MNFQHLLLDGEINLNILNKIIKNIGNIKTLEYKSSNGLSFVFISEENSNVFQYYKYENTCIKIKNIFGALLRCSLINKKIYFTKVIYNLNFNICDFLANFIEYINQDNIIVWQKHTCLNSFSKDVLTDILINNIVKILWDISKGLYGLHFNLILHGDARIDNIAIKNNNFVLFDFDSSNMGNEIVSFRKDNWDFLKSLEFNIGKDNWKNILISHPYISDTDFIINDMLEYISKKSSKNINLVIEDLNALQIII
jgi:hypothetical protein